MLRYPGIFLVLLFATVPASAASWTDGLFEEHAKDFGVVARGPMLTHPFRLTNNTGQPIHISGVRVSCGCVSARAVQSDVPAGQSTTIVADMDTRRFQGAKRVIVYVSFDRPQWEEVALSVQAFSRDDFSIAPAELTLGKVAPGSKPSATITASFYGQQNLRVTNVESSTSYVQTSVKELRRDTGEVTYQVTATLRDDAPAGNWYTELWLKTDNSGLSNIRVPLTVEIEPAKAVTKSNDAATSQAASAKQPSRR